ncbi:MAG: UDP-N-acetylglucosamine--N-acetylmuramyl-(pentapeptide) pyrophosphoryl-undecaprenol N-acetylglucosamine transferase [Clostridia bacterium]|nr:UDP-N-acetylglucosamine--N-acetylmuramyl-(pentapeptide) pyrophosphoryl-undecaprenol N-acetylglucosamine transferase [Clostridia bacterium]
MLRVLMTGGGSGGHVNPAIAIADTIRLNCPDAKIAFVGTETGKENDLVPRAGYPLYYVDSMGLQRSLTPSNIKAAFLAVTSPHSKKTLDILDEFQPDLVVGTGGYVCWPLIRAAARRKIPTVLHESNCYAGLTVRMLQSSVSRLLLNFEETVQQLHAKKKCCVVGNPLLGGFGALPQNVAREKLGLAAGEQMVLFCAGSLGSQTVNHAVLEFLRCTAAKRPQVRFVLATGKRHYKNCLAMAQEIGLDELPNVQLKDYIYDMPVQMSAADVVVSRAGAMTLSELAMMGKACVIIPSPYVADDHQLKNAQALANRGAALLVEEKDFAKNSLQYAILSLLDDRDLSDNLRREIGNFATPDANRVIYDILMSLVKEDRERKANAGRGRRKNGDRHA